MDLFSADGNKSGDMFTVFLFFPFGLENATSTAFCAFCAFCAFHAVVCLWNDAHS